MKSYSLETKLAEIEYEIKMRRRVYPNRVLTRRMKQGEADMRIDIMESIARDYENAIERRNIEPKEQSNGELESC